MMDTEILFRDGRRFTNDFNDIPSLTTSDLADSTSSDGVDTDTFTSEICSWNYDSGLVKNFELMLDRYDLDPISTDDFHTVVEEWENTVKVENEEPVLDQKPLLSEFETLKEIAIKPTITVKPEPETSNDTNFDVVYMQTKIPGFDDLVSVPLFEYPDDKFAVNDLPANLDLCSFINGEELTTPQEPKNEKGEPRAPKFKAGRKRIDLKAQKYIVGDVNDEEEEEENVDVETVSEGGSNPVLEAGDLNSLLEQFEASEVEVNDASVNNSKEREILKSDESTPCASNVSQNAQTSEQSAAEHENEVKGALPDASASLPSDQKKTQPEYVSVTSKKGDASERKKHSLTVVANNKQIIEALPQELINRIKESGKRKRIAIIDPVPNSSSKRRKLQENSPLSRPVLVSPAINPSTYANLLSIELDHSYCAVITSAKRPPKKDSGYLSAEEEDKFLHNQPIVKNADGKLMISLLKINTIRSNLEENKKKKLNIEEYKMRRLGILNTPTSSQSNSPMSSNCSSPLPAEDENTKRLRHEEKLRKMALELLSTPPKSSCNTGKSSPSNQMSVPIKTVAPSPTDMDVITYVSIGVNTDITGRNPLTPAEKLEEIKPLLKNASVKISRNSLINSLIENIPKVIKPEEPDKVKEIHGEDKTIIYLPKKRKLPETLHVGVQTSITLLGDNKRRYRRRKDSSSSSSSSCSEIKSCKRSSRSQTSRYSKSSRSSRSTSISSSSSRSSFRTRSRSSSRSPSPHRKRKRNSFDQEYIQEVEERRVVYVGKIASKTTKKDLYRRFSKFGPIKTISLHFRDHGDNYGFVTFENKLDAYEAIEHGNDDPYDIQYDLSFGGRRLFCKTSYSDLDNMREDCGYLTSTSLAKPSGAESFDRLLKEMQEKLKRRKV